ncbi:MAG: hypothetical protein MUF21_03505 [Gemmatimonadaceae bacterium]|nr:hypothetical protein [Gemmatimonadaceae bacterium]
MTDHSAMIPMRSIRRGISLLAALLATAALPVRAAHAQWSTVYEQFYLQAPHNWTFRTDYTHADRLFNAFDYGHAILYETLWTKPGAPASLLEERIYDRLVRGVLVRPPRNPLEEAAIEPMYARLAPEAKVMFDWAHILHRQLYDVLADERLDGAAKDREVARIIAYYKSRPDLAFSSKPKSMALMQEQPYSLAFRKTYPKFNGLIWGYHWLQIGLYEPLVTGRTREERQAGVRATVARFWQMLDDAPRHMPHQMPMTPAVAPAFAARYPEAGIIFDNLHSMHDVVSDILANPSVPRAAKRREIMRAARLFRDDSSYVMGSTAAWVRMSNHMGIENMGGPAVGFLPAMPTPSVTYGAVMTHDDRTGEMTGFRYGNATGGDHAAHGAPAAAAPAAGGAQPDHGAHAGHAMPTTGDSLARGAASLVARLLTDPVVRQRVLADSALHAAVVRAAQQLPEGERAAIHAALHADGGTHATPAARPAPAPGTPRR